MARYRHWRNWGEQGDSVFVTTTCLGFARLLERETMRDAMVASLARDCLEAGSCLDGFVAMPNHVHFICAVPAGQTIGWLIQRIKGNSAARLRSLLLPGERAQIADRRGLGRRGFWQASFRSVVIANHKMHLQKLDYIHGNPVRAGLVARPEDYRWSSARLYEQGLYDEDRGLAAQALALMETERDWLRRAR